MAKFIVRENHIHHLSTFYREKDFLEEISLLYEEDLLLFRYSTFYIAQDDSGIVGSVKVTLWDAETVLPIEKLFDLKIKNILSIKEENNIWHVGRFAISQKEGMHLLKRLLVMAISSICKDAKSIMVAECDKKFVRVLNLMGIRTETLAASVFYLGSETLPIYSTYEWLSNFLAQAIPSLPLEKGSGSLLHAI